MRLTVTEHTRRLEAYNRGLTDREAAQELGIGKTTFAVWRKYHGMEFNPEPLFDVGSRPKRERRIVRGFLSDLLRLCEQANRVPNETGITRFMNIWREGGVV